jgi:hypothetical protein
MSPRIFSILLLIQYQTSKANPQDLCERIYGYNQSLNRPLGLDKIENIQNYKFLGRGNPGRGGHVYLVQATDAECLQNL